MKKGKKKQTTKSINEIVEELKKKGTIPSDFKTSDIKEIDRIGKEDIGKLVAFKATVKGVGIKMSPPIIIVSECEGETYPSGYGTKLLDVEVMFEKGCLLAKFKGHKERTDVISFFNRLMSIFNIAGVPFDFISDSEIIMFMEGLGREIQAISSATAQRRGSGMSTIRVKGIEFSKMVFAVWAIWELTKKSDYFQDNDLYQLLGYSRYHYFHGNFSLSFVHGWLFIEAMINLMWRKLMTSKFKKKSPTKSEREWTCMIKIDELRMLGEIDENQRGTLQKLRQKRNAVFHVDPQRQKREVTGDSCLEVIKSGLAIFYKLIGLPPEKGVIDFQNIAKQMYAAIHAPS